MDVYDYLDSNGYTNPNPYPAHPTKPPAPGGKSTSSDYRAYASRLERYEDDIVAYGEDVAIWQALTKSLAGKFEPDLAKYYNMTDHPKRVRLYEIAYDMGHSAGLHEVANYYATLVDLLL